MIHKQTHSFKNAFSGLSLVLKTQSNMKIHLALSTIALTASVILQISYFELLVVMLLVIIGLTLEILNTAIELTIDSVHTDWHEGAKKAKDVSSAAMLVFSIGASIISAILFIPKIIALL